MKRIGVTVSCISLLLFFFIGMGYGEEGREKAPPDNGPKAVFPEAVYKFEPVFEGVDVLHDFVIQNKGGATLDVKKVSGG